jgi:hypothetical protein
MCAVAHIEARLVENLRRLWMDQEAPKRPDGPETAGELRKKPTE